MNPAELAREYVALRSAHAEAAEEAERLSRLLRATADQLRDHLDLGEAVPAGPGRYVVLTRPERRPAARVLEEGVAEFREVLLSLDLIERKEITTRPSVSAIRKAAPVLAAHGVPVERLLIEPEGVPVLSVVNPEGGNE